MKIRLIQTISYSENHADSSEHLIFSFVWSLFSFTNNLFVNKDSIEEDKMPKGIGMISRMKDSLDKRNTYFYTCCLWHKTKEYKETLLLLTIEMNYTSLIVRETSFTTLCTEIAFLSRNEHCYCH